MSPRRSLPRRWIVAALIAAALVMVAPGQALAQVPSAPVTVEVRLTDGSVLYGVVQSETVGRVVIRTIAGVVVDIERAQILALSPARGRVVNGEFLPADSNATRLMFSPTGRAQQKGHGYVGVYEFVLPFVQYGATDRLSFGVGTPLVFSSDETSRPFWVTPKYQFYKGPRTSAAAGVMHFEVVGGDARFGLAYAVSTTGTDDDALTLGLGWAYARYHDNVYDYSTCLDPTQKFTMPCGDPSVTRTTKTRGSALGMIGGEHRVSRRVKLLTENYVFDEGGLVSVGVRFLGERLTADLGVFAPVGVDAVILIPVINVVWSFGP